MKRIGLMGGTFDPIHHGHLVTAEHVRYVGDLDQVLFIPAGSPPHKTGGAAVSAEDRLAMVELAIADNPYFHTCDFEVRQQGPSYSITTVQYLREVLGPDVELFFIIGADAINLITTWMRWRELLTLCRFFAMTRPGYTMEDFSGLAPEPGLLQQRIQVVEVPALEISSTEIRSRIQRGWPIKYLVPHDVEQYICQHQLYGPIGRE